MADLFWFEGHEFTDTNGNPLNGGLIRIYDATTSNERTVYRDAEENVPWLQPITLNSSGRLTDPIYVPSGTWKFVRTNSLGLDSITQDNIPGAVTIPSSVFAKIEMPVLTKATNYTVVVGDLGKKINVDTTGGDVTITMVSAITAADGFLSIQNVGTGSVSIEGAGAQTVNGATSIKLLGQFDSADLSSDGADWSANISAELRPTLAKSADYTILRSDTGRIILVDASGGNKTMTLPATISFDSGMDVEIKKTDNSSNTVTIDGDGGDTIDGATTYVIRDQWQSAHIIQNGVNWFISGRHEPGASTTIPGLIEIATEAENRARTATDLAVVPAYNPFHPGHLFGLVLSNAADATNDITASAGSCNDGGDNTNMILASAITKRIDAAWAVGTNQGGLDTGSAANTTYYMWLIKRNDTGVVDMLFSVSASAPTMPANYTIKRRIGAIIRTGATILAFVQSGDKFWLGAPVGDISATNPGTSAVTRLLTVPVGLAVEALVTHGLHDVSPSADTFGLLTALSQTDTTPSIAAYDVWTTNTSAGQPSGSVYRTVLTNTSGQIRSRLSNSTVSIIQDIITFGWIDTRGRLA